MAAFHAWKFTHFRPGAVQHTKDETQLSFGEKLSALFFGVSLPRPENRVKPTGRYQTIMLRSNKRIECWEIPADSPAGAIVRGTVVLCHGYGGAKASMLEKADIFRQAGYNTLLPDFEGAGGSEGNTCTIGYDEAAQVRSCVNYLQAKGEHNIVLFGLSMGAAAIMKAMHDTAMPVRALILECPYGSMLRTVQNRFHSVGVPHFPLANLLVFWGGFENGFNAFRLRPEDYACDIHCPTLLVWGGKDPKVSEEETDTIFARLVGPKRVLKLPQASHNDFLLRYRAE